MTPAQEKGLEVGKQYIITGGYEEDHDFKVGTIVTFTRDDGSDCPRFDGPNDCGDGYSYPDLKYIGELGASNSMVTFTNEQRTYTVEVTVVRVDRKLTQGEQDAITAIIKGGK